MHKMRYLFRSLQLRCSGGEIIMAAKIEITIDGNVVSVEKDSFLLNAIENLGIKLPTLCNH